MPRLFFHAATYASCFALFFLFGWIGTPWSLPTGVGEFDHGNAQPHSDATAAPVDSLAAVFQDYADATLRLAEALYFEGRLDEGLDAVDGALRLLPDTSAAFAPYVARLYVKKGKLLAFRSFTANAGYADGLAALDEARRIAGPLGLEEVIADGDLFTGFLHYARTYNTGEGRYDVAMGYFQRALQQREAAGDERGVAEAHIYVGIIHERQGDDAGAIEHYRQALDLSTRGDFKLEKSYATRHLAFQREAAGDLDAALALFKESLALREAIGFRIYLPFSYLSVGDVYLEQDEPEQALPYYRKALAMAEALGAKRVQVLCLLSLGQLYAGTGSTADAQDAFEQARRLASDIGYESGVTRAQAGLDNLGN